MNRWLYFIFGLNNFWTLRKSMSHINYSYMLHIMWIMCIKQFLLGNNRQYFLFTDFRCLNIGDSNCAAVDNSTQIVTKIYFHRRDHINLYLSRCKPYWIHPTSEMHFVVKYFFFFPFLHF